MILRGLVVNAEMSARWLAGADEVDDAQLGVVVTAVVFRCWVMGLAARHFSDYNNGTKPGANCVSLGS